MVKDSTLHEIDGELLEFHDAIDDFPYYDSEETFSDSVESSEDVSLSAYPNLEQLKEDDTLISSGLRRRRSLPHHKSVNGNSSKSSSICSDKNMMNSSNHRESRKLLGRSEVKGYEKKVDDNRNEKLGFSIMEKSAGSVTQNVNLGNSEKRVETSNRELDLRETDRSHSSVLLVLAGFVVKAIGLQMNLLCKFLAFPVWSVYKLCLFIHDPFGFVKKLRGCLLRKIKRICSFAVKTVSPVVYEWLKEHNGWWRLGLKCGWGFLWSCYVCAVLVGLLLSAFVIGGLFVRVVVNEPVRIKRNLNFDYTEKSPVALVPLKEPKGSHHDTYFEEMPGFAKSSGSRVVPPNHKLKITVSLTLPESDYNQNLGIFQVRIDFLTADGKTRASSRRPCMLQYKSLPIRLLLTFLKAVPILSGYSSETQKIKIHFRGFTEGEIPIAFLRVIVEQRAEFLPGAGIPQIYTASLKLESELPLLKRLIWSWKKTLFIWFSLTIFTFELGFALICCKPLIVPRVRLRRPDQRDVLENNSPVPPS